MTFLRKHWRFTVVVTVLFFPVTAAGLMLWAGLEIASPTRRPLADYHREFLKDPSAQGLMIESFTISDGTPCLVCQPDPTGKIGERGSKIRQQLTDRGMILRPFGETVGTLVLVHGRKGRKEDYLPIAERLCAVGFRCVIPDLPAHGDHPGVVATFGVREAGLPARVLAETTRKFAFRPQPAGLLGVSMGGSVSVYAAALPDAPWQALAIVASFDSFPKVIEAQAARYLGHTLGPLWASGTHSVYQWKTGMHPGDIQPGKHAASIKIPTLIAHGTADRVSSVHLGKSLFDSLPETTPRKWIEIPGADHDNVLVTNYPIYADLAEWMLKMIATTSQAARSDSIPITQAE